MSEPARTLDMRVARLSLEESDDLDVRFPPQFSHVVIHADVVRVAGRVWLPGRTLELYARVVEPAARDGHPACIDVSGAPATPDFDVDERSPKLDGTASSPNGKPGADGGAGADAGGVTIVAERIDGDLAVVADGSRGGNSQRGGNGAQPPTKNGRDGTFVKAKWPARSRFGGGVLQEAGIGNRYVSWAAGEQGGAAVDGGDAGAPGRPGDGGRGGNVTVHLCGDGPHTPTLRADGGAPGRPGLPAEPGPPGKAGVGGRNRIYRYDVTKTKEAYARAGEDDVIDRFARQYKIPARAPGGTPEKAAPGKVPAPPEAAAGAPGRCAVERAGHDDVAVSFDLEYLRLLRARVERDVARGVADGVDERCRWLERLSASRAGSDAGFGAVHAWASRALAREQRG